MRELMVADTGQNFYVSLLPDRSLLEKWTRPTRERNERALDRA